MLLSIYSSPVSLLHDNSGNFLVLVLHPAEQAGGDDHPDHLQQGNTQATKAH